MKKAIILCHLAAAIGILLSACSGAPRTFNEPCHEERAIVLINNSAEPLTFYALDTGGTTLRAEVPAHTTRREWLSTGAWKFLVDNKDKQTINEYPGIEAYLKRDSGTLNMDIYDTVQTASSTWILWRVDTLAGYYDPTIWYDMTASHNYAASPVDFMYGDDKGKDEAWYARQLAHITPLFYSGRKPFVVYQRSTANIKVFTPEEQLPAKVTAYKRHMCLTSLDTMLGRSRDEVTARVIADIMSRGTTSDRVDYGNTRRHIGAACK